MGSDEKDNFRTGLCLESRGTSRLLQPTLSIRRVGCSKERRQSRMTHRQGQARNWIIAYFVWLCSLFLWNSGWYDDVTNGHATFGYYLFFTLELLVIVGIARR